MSGTTKPDKPMSEWTVDEMKAVFAADRCSLQVLSPVPKPDGGESWMYSPEFVEWAMAHIDEVLPEVKRAE